MLKIYQNQAQHIQEFKTVDQLKILSDIQQGNMEGNIKNSKYSWVCLLKVQHWDHEEYTSEPMFQFSEWNTTVGAPVRRMIDLLLT